MIVYPNAKINIGLNILKKRDDGFHAVESMMYPIGLKDILEIVPSESDLPKGYQFIQSGLQIDGTIENNLCVKALLLLKEYTDFPSVKIHLHKQIPFGGGLGGGSADAAFTLKLVNQLFNLGITMTKLQSIAAQLGSDCPFFIENKPALATGRGEILQPLPVDLSGYYLVLINPEIHIGTAEAYSEVTPHIPEKMITSLIGQDISFWKNEIKNDFESSIFPKYPAIMKIKQKLYDKGAVYASMSGSGSSVYGIFKEKIDLKDEFQGYFLFNGFFEEK